MGSVCARTASTLNHWAISPALITIFLRCDCSFSLLLCAHVYRCASKRTFVCVCVWYMYTCSHAHRGQRFIFTVFLSCSLSRFLRQGLSRTLERRNLERLAPVSPRNPHLSLLTVSAVIYGTGVQVHQHTQVFYVHSEGSNSGPHVYATSTPRVKPCVPGSSKFPV